MEQTLGKSLEIITKLIEGKKPKQIQHELKIPHVSEVYRAKYNLPLLWWGATKNNE